MKISLLHYSAPPIVGGVESVIEHHARLMANDGHQVQVIAGRGAQFDPRVGFIHIPLLDSRHEEVLELKAELDRGVVPDRFVELTSRMETELRKVLASTDVLIAHNVCSLHKNLALTAALFNISKDNKKMRTILWHHDLAWTTPRYRHELHPGHPWDLLKTPWPNVKQVVVSDLREDELVELMNLDRADINVVPNGVDLERFYKLEDQTCSYIRELGLLEASPLLLLPVRITPRKNIELAVRVLASLRVQFPLAQMVVTGPLGPHNPANVAYFEHLHSLRRELSLQKAVHFLAELTEEYIPDAVISDFYHLADALLFPSYEEGFGIPILEAGLAGLPVFCSDIPPLRKLGGEFASYFSLDDDPQIIASIIMERLSTSRIFGLRTRVRTEYIWQQVYQREIAPLLQGKEA